VTEFFKVNYYFVHIIITPNHRASSPVQLGHHWRDAQEHGLKGARRAAAVPDRGETQLPRHGEAVPGHRQVAAPGRQPAAALRAAAERRDARRQDAQVRAQPPAEVRPSMRRSVSR